MPIEYINRTKRYYQALGYGAPYEWAKAEIVPFTGLKKPIQQTRVTLISTAAPFNPDAGDQGPGAPYNGAAKFYKVQSLPMQELADVRISHVAIDRDHTTAEDIGSYFPQAALLGVKARTELRLTAHLHLLPTNRSIRTTTEIDAPELVRRCLQDRAEAAIIVPNCPVCHQSCALAANQLEAAGISTVIMGAALDIVEHVGAPRLLFSDVPLGNAAGLPNDQESQAKALSAALDLLQNATAARSVAQSGLVWPGKPDWRDDYSNPDKLSSSEIARRKAEFDLAKREAKAIRG